LESFQHFQLWALRIFSEACFKRIPFEISISFPEKVATVTEVIVIVVAVAVAAASVVVVVVVVGVVVVVAAAAAAVVVVMEQFDSRRKVSAF
jgi:hypothetical protein